MEDSIELLIYIAPEGKYRFSEYRDESLKMRVYLSSAGSPLGGTDYSFTSIHVGGNGDDLAAITPTPSVSKANDLEYQMGLGLYADKFCFLDENSHRIQIICIHFTP